MQGRGPGLAVALLAAGLWAGPGCADEPAAVGLGGQCDLNSECEAPLVCRLARCRRECATLRDCPIDALCVTDNESLGACTLPEEQSCTLNSDCPEPLRCAMGRCVNQCAADADCLAGARCQEGACIDPVEDACAVDSDCMAPLVCATDRRCRAECVVDRDCREGTACEEGVCTRPPEVDAGSPEMDAGPPEMDAGMDAGPPDVDAGDDPWDPGSFWTDAGYDAGPFDGSLPLCMDGSVCDSAPNATTGCVAGRCEIVSCTAPWADCNGIAVDGCETNTATHRDHCTACGSACPAGEACLDAACVAATVTDISTVGGASCALWSTGDITCWGRMSDGRLGNGVVSTESHPVPVNVLLIDDAVAIDAGSSHTCALRSDDTLWCWGWNFYGQLGDGTTTTTATPVQVTGLTGVEAFDLSGSQTCARTSDGLLHCWGNNRYGGIGTGTVGGTVSTPTEVTGLGTVGLFAVGAASFAITTSGQLMGWGRDWDGEITGSTTRTEYGSPRAVSALDGLGITPVAIQGGGSPKVVGSDGRVWCWGSNSNFTCGISTLVTELWPAMEVTGLSDVAGIDERCAVTTTGEVWCWGYHDRGSAGTGDREYPYDTPRQALGITDAVQVSHSSGHSCIRHDAGSVSCSGYNLRGEIGDGTYEQRLTFVPVVGMP